MFKQTLYKKDSKGKIRMLEVSAVDGNLIQVSGLLGGKLVTHSSLCKPKNIGKVNETTAITQAISEAESKVKQKLNEGYFLTQQEAEDEVVILPMLAKDYKKEKKKVKFPCYVQPKLDGMRALLINGKFYSRKGKLIDTVPHLDIKSDLILDGELYAHGLTFQENMSLIKKYRKGESEQIQYHIYDVVLDKPYEERLEVIAHFTIMHDNVKVVRTVKINNEQDLINFHKDVLHQGYEGSIIRHGKEGYAVNKRSSQILKYKDFIDLAAKVIDVEPSDKNPEQGVVVCQMDDAKIFKCGMKFSHADREEILKNKQKYIGKMAEVRFFEYTDDGLLRFPVCVGFRLDK